MLSDAPVGTMPSFHGMEYSYTIGQTSPVVSTARDAESTGSKGRLGVDEHSEQDDQPWSNPFDSEPLVRPRPEEKEKRDLDVFGSAPFHKRLVAR